MIPYLPPELTRQIIESAIPWSYHSTTYDNRQTLLRSLCLVSHRFREIAQSLLYEIVVFSREESDRMTELKYVVINQWTTPIRQIVVEVENHDQRLELAASNASRVENLIISDCCRTQKDLHFFLRFTELRSLRIYTAVALTESLSFPLLQSLTIGGQHDASTLRLSLTRSKLPSLRALALTHVKHAWLSSILAHSPTLSLVMSLDAFFIDDLYTTQEICDGLKKVLSSTLVTSRTCGNNWASSFLETLHLRLSGGTADIYCEFLAQTIESSVKSPITSLYLDAWLSPDNTRTSQSTERLRRLVAACTARGVEIVYEDGPGNSWLDPFISPEFWRRQRERRRVEGDQAK